MNIFPFNRNNKLDEFAVSLSSEYLKASSLEKGKPSGKIDRKLAKANSALFNMIKDFRKENKLGIYKKARIGNKFMWHLREHGIDKDHAEEVTRQLLLKLNE